MSARRAGTLPLPDWSLPRPAAGSPMSTGALSCTAPATRPITAGSSLPTDAVMRHSAPSQRTTGPGADQRLLLVDGIDGSGKTRFAARLVEAMRNSGADVTLAHVDDYRRPVEWDDPAGEAAVYWDRYFDLAALERNVAGMTGAGQLVVLEGIFTLRLPAFANAPLFYLEVDFEIAARRILERDTALGRTPEDVRH